ncbi:hypothetical protein K8R62_04065 [bacterium]|nr:hypothetical protein [bacterium]
MKVKITVTGKARPFEFNFIVHVTESIESRKLEDDFYVNYSKNRQVPIGKHHEIEIISPDLSKESSFKWIHVHRSKKDNKLYVCIVDHLSTIEETLEILEMWAAGTLYTIRFHKMFDCLIAEDEAINRDYKNALKKLKDNFNIVANIEA